GQEERQVEEDEEADHEGEEDRESHAPSQRAEAALGLGNRLLFLDGRLGREGERLDADAKRFDQHDRAAEDRKAQQRKAARERDVFARLHGDRAVGKPNGSGYPFRRAHHHAFDDRLSTDGRVAIGHALRGSRSGGVLGLLHPVLPAEALDATGRVDQLLLAGEERVAVRTDFDVQRLLHGGARLDHVPADADDPRVEIGGVNALLHGLAPCSLGDQVFIMARNFLFVLVWLILPIKNSIASIGFNSFRNLRRIQTLFSSSCVIRSSSLRVPDRLMSMAGKTRLSASLRSRMTSMLPVPLNSSKMTSSMRLPVSIRAVAMIVRLPPFSMLRAAPKNRFGFWSAFASTPPDRILPEWGTTVLWARAKRVIESRRITTSRLCSTRRFAFSMTMSATCTWRSAGSSNVDETTSPFTDRSMSVTSSGRSSIRSTMSITSGWFSVIAFAIFWRRTVFPARGGDTMSPRCPFPMGVSRSMIRVDMSSALNSIRSFS